MVQFPLIFSAYKPTETPVSFVYIQYCFVLGFMRDNYRYDNVQYFAIAEELQSNKAQHINKESMCNLT